MVLTAVAYHLAASGEKDEIGRALGSVTENGPSADRHVLPEVVAMTDRRSDQVSMKEVARIGF